MSGTMKGFLLTGAGWLSLILAYSAIELVRGHRPFAMMQWNVGGKFVTIVVVVVMVLGTAVGYASDRIQEKQRR